MTYLNKCTYVADPNRKRSHVAKCLFDLDIFSDVSKVKNEQAAEGSKSKSMLIQIGITLPTARRRERQSVGYRRAGEHVGSRPMTEKV